MIDAIMTPEELTEKLDQTGLTRHMCAWRLSVTTLELRRMEAGVEPIPARFDDDIEDITSFESRE